MKLKATIISLVSIFIVGLTAILLYCYWPAIKGTVDDSKYYTAEDLQESYDKGFNDGCKSEIELTGQVKYYKELVDEYSIQVNTLNSEISMLNSKNEKIISQFKSQIENLQNEISVLENSDENKDKDIAQKNSQISSLQATVAQLQRTNELNLDTITNLNNQIISLNSQISDLTLQIQNNSSNVTALNNKIAELEKSVSYYEKYIANLENGEQVVITFEFDGSVYNIQIINKNDTVSVVNPTSSDNIIFNFWTINDEQIDLSTYQFTTNTKVVANVTYKYDVKFMVDSNEYNSQLVTKDGYVTLPDNPTKDGYEFDGWTIDSVNLVSDIATKPVTQNITYVAKFTKLHTVTFMYEDTIIKTQTIRNGEYSTNVTVDSTTYKVFNGWKLNDVIVDVSTQKIYADIILVADITYKYDVKFMVDDEVYDSQIVTKDGYISLPDNPTKVGYEFNGWSINGVDIISNIETILVIQNTTYYALFEFCPYFAEFSIDIDSFDHYFSISGDRFWTDGANYYYSDPCFNDDGSLSYGHYVLNKETGCWEEKIWNGIQNFYGYNIWTDGENMFCGLSLALDKESSTWNEITWECNYSDFFNYFDASYIFQINNETYMIDNLSCSFVLNKGTHTWSKVTFSVADGSYWAGSSSYIWTDGKNIFSSCLEHQYILDVNTLTWNKFDWKVNTNISKFQLNGSSVWTDGEDVYCMLGNFSGYKCCVLDKESYTWNVIDLKDLNYDNIGSIERNYMVNINGILYYFYFGHYFKFIKG